MLFEWTLVLPLPFVFVRFPVRVRTNTIRHYIVAREGLDVFCANSTSVFAQHSTIDDDDDDDDEKKRPSVGLIAVIGSKTEGKLDENN